MTKNKKNKQTGSEEEQIIKGKNYFFFDKCLIKTYGVDLFPNFINDDARKINTVYVPNDSEFSKEEKENPNVESFINYVLENGEQDPDNLNKFTINKDISIIFQEPTKEIIDEKNIDIEAVTTLASRRLNLSCKGIFKAVRFPRFETKLEEYLDMGYVSQPVSNEQYKRFAEKNEINIYSLKSNVPKICFVNQFLKLSNKKHDLEYICKVVDNDGDLVAKNIFPHVKSVEEFKKEIDNPFFNINPNSEEQALALKLLLDPNINLVFLLGAASTGKSFLSLSTGIYQLMTKEQTDEPKYQRFVFLRETGDKLKELYPEMRVYNNLFAKSGVSSNPLYNSGNEFSEKISSEKGLNLFSKPNKPKIVEYSPIYLTGNTFSGDFVFLDEAQNLNIEQIKNVIGHLGENSKLIISGDIAQRKSKFENQSNGLLWAVEKYISKVSNKKTGLIKLDKSMSLDLAREAYN